MLDVAIWSEIYTLFEPLPEKNAESYLKFLPIPRFLHNEESQ